MSRAKTTWTLRLETRKASAADCRPTVYMAGGAGSLFDKGGRRRGQNAIDVPSFN